jgi:hypothetical protein
VRDHPGDANSGVTVTPVTLSATDKGAGAHEEANPVDMEEQTVEHFEDDQPTKQVVNEYFSNDGITDAQEIEAPSSSNSLTKVVIE